MRRKTLKYDTVVAFLVEKGAKAGQRKRRATRPVERIRADREPPALRQVRTLRRSVSCAQHWFWPGDDDRAGRRPAAHAQQPGASAVARLRVLQDEGRSRSSCEASRPRALHRVPRQRDAVALPAARARRARRWSEEDSRKNFQAIQRVAQPGNLKSRLLMHPLEEQAGGDFYHNGGKHFASQNDPEWQVLKTFVMGQAN